MAKREPDPLIPEDELKKFVRVVVAVPKEEVKKIEAERPKRKKASNQKPLSPKRGAN